MANYTITLKTICESLTEKTAPTTLDEFIEIIPESATKIFDFDYGYFNPARKANFEEQFILRFALREIGLETYGRFKIKLIAKLRDIMPYYEDLYHIKVAQAGLSMFDTVSMSRQITNNENNTEGKQNTSSEQKNATGTGTTSSTNADETENSYSDTPQGAVTDVKEGRYLTNYTYNKDNSTATDTSTNTQEQTAQYTSNQNTTQTKANTMNETWNGKEGGQSYASMVKELKEVIYNIDMMVYDECEDLFMGVF